MTREQWLNKLAKRLETVLFKPAGATLPKVRYTCGWPSVRAMSGRIGECWGASCSSDDTHEVIVSMALEDPMRVAGVVAHEMVHAVVGLDAGHGPAFRKLALAIGLEGLMTATAESDMFKEKVQPMLGPLGPYPHAKLSGSNHKKQSTRLIKVACEHKSCMAQGYTVRMSNKWIVDYGCPLCPECEETMQVC